jgi:hypothetical protein
VGQSRAGGLVVPWSGRGYRSRKSGSDGERDTPIPVYTIPKTELTLIHPYYLFLQTAIQGDGGRPRVRVTRSRGRRNTPAEPIPSPHPPSPHQRRVEGGHRLGPLLPRPLALHASQGHVIGASGDPAAGNRAATGGVRFLAVRAVPADAAEEPAQAGGHLRPKPAGGRQSPATRTIGVHVGERESRTELTSGLMELTQNDHHQWRADQAGIAQIPRPTHGPFLWPYPRIAWLEGVSKRNRPGNWADRQRTAMHVRWGVQRVLDVLSP